MGKQVTFVLAAFVQLVLLLAYPARAPGDEIRDKLDQAKGAYTDAVELATKEAVQSFDQQIRIVSQTGDLDAVQALRSQRGKFVASRTPASTSSLRGAMEKYQADTTTAEHRLRSAYEAAIVGYTKAGRFDDAENVKRAMIERFTPPENNPGATTLPSDAVLETLLKAKVEFARAIAAAHAEVLAVIDEKARAASANGQLDAYRALTSLHARVEAEIVVPDEVIDIAIRTANAKLLRTADMEYRKLRLAYEEAVRAYTKALRIDEAEVVKREMDEGGWMEKYARQTKPSAVFVTVDLLKAIKIGRDTIRAGWRFDNDVLRPAAWSNEHGPLIEVPVSVTGGYELRGTFTLGRAADDVYFLVPVEKGSGVVCVRNNGQNFLDIDGTALTGSQTLQLGVTHDLLFRVTVANGDRVQFVLTLDGQPTIVWEGSPEKVRKAGEMWQLADRSHFGIATKYGQIRELKVITPASGLTRMNVPREGGASAPMTTPGLFRPSNVADADINATSAAQAAKQARDRCLQRFQTTDRYGELKAKINAAQSAFDAANAPGADATIRARCATTLFEAKRALSEAAEREFKSDPAVTSADAAFEQAARIARELRHSGVNRR